MPTQSERIRSIRLTKKWLLIPIVYLIGSAVVGTYLANRGKITLPEAPTSTQPDDVAPDGEASE